TKLLKTVFFISFLFGLFSSCFTLGFIFQNNILDIMDSFIKLKCGDFTTNNIFSQIGREINEDILNILNALIIQFFILALIYIIFNKNKSEQRKNIKNKKNN
ncbi:MAG: hypothetical protein MJ252_11730, partial [archaeon]|nr:hypothetical protein [archaeon]